MTADPSGPPVARQGAPTEAHQMPFDLADEWGRQSFPASDLPANW